jgi:hypothetical protein
MRAVDPPPTRATTDAAKAGFGPHRALDASGRRGRKVGEGGLDALRLLIGRWTAPARPRRRPPPPIARAPAPPPPRPARPRPPSRAQAATPVQAPARARSRGGGTPPGPRRRTGAAPARRPTPAALPSHRARTGRRRWSNCVHLDVAVRPRRGGRVQHAIADAAGPAWTPAGFHPRRASSAGAAPRPDAVWSRSLRSRPPGLARDGEKGERTVGPAARQPPSCQRRIDGLTDSRRTPARKSEGEGRPVPDQGRRGRRCGRDRPEQRRSEERTARCAGFALVPLVGTPYRSPQKRLAVSGAGRALPRQLPRPCRRRFDRA